MIRKLNSKMNIMTKLCSKCGVAMDATQGFCNLCGTAWTAGPTVASGPARSGVLKPLLIGVVVLLVLAVGVGGWLYARNHARPVSEVATARPMPAAGSPSTAACRREAFCRKASFKSCSNHLEVYLSADGRLIRDIIG
jgi:hypothetical protein